MNVKLIFTFLLFSLLCVSCSENCSENVSPPRASFFVEIIDEVSEENVFTNLTYLETDVLVKDNNDEDVEFFFIKKEGLNLIQILPATILPLNNTIFIKIANDENIEVKYNVETISTECYSQSKIINVETPSYTTTYQNQIFRIKI